MAGLDRSEGRLDLAERRLASLLDWLGTIPNRSGEQHRWRRDLRSASRLLASVLVEQGKPGDALRVWDVYQRHEDRMLDAADREQPAAEPDVLTITVVQLESRYGLWASLGDSVQFRWIEAAPAELHRQARLFRRSCLDPNASAATAGGYLADHLLNPLASRIDSAKALTVRLDGGLQDLPLHALPFAGKSLGEMIPVAYRVSATPPALLQPLRVRRALVAAAGPLPSELSREYPPLPGIADEAARIADSVPGSELLTGSAATAVAFERALPGRDLVHFSGHAAAGPDGVSLLLGAESARASFWRIPARLPGAPRLAVLGACATAVHDEIESVAPRHLAHAFLRAGTGQVLAALWNLDHVAASRYFAAYYAALAAGSAPVLAARAAANEVRKAGYRHPYYWAPFALFV